MCVCPVNTVYLQCVALGPGPVVGEVRSGAVCVYVWDFLLFLSTEGKLVSVGQLQKDNFDSVN